VTGDPLTYHVGHPVHPADALDRLARGLPVYRPTDPKPIDQRPYLAYARKEGRP
jgi:hypothetical protein